MLHRKLQTAIGIAHEPRETGFACALGGHPERKSKDPMERDLVENRLLVAIDYRCSQCVRSRGCFDRLNMTGKPVSHVRILRLFLVESNWHCNANHCQQTNTPHTNLQNQLRWRERKPYCGRVAGIEISKIANCNRHCTRTKGNRLRLRRCACNRNATRRILLLLRRRGGRPHRC